MPSLRESIPKIVRHNRENAYLLSPDEIDASLDVLRCWSMMILRWLAYPGEHRFHMITRKRWPYTRKHQVVGWRSLKETNQELRSLAAQQQNISDGRDWSWWRMIPAYMSVQSHLALGSWWLVLQELQNHYEAEHLQSWLELIKGLEENKPDDHPDADDTRLRFFPSDWIRFLGEVLRKESNPAYHAWDLAVNSINLGWQETKDRRALRIHLLEWLAWLEETEAIAGERMWLFITEPELCPLPMPELPELSIVPPKLLPIEEGLILQANEVSHYLNALADVVEWYDQVRRKLDWIPRPRDEYASRY